MFGGNDDADDEEESNQQRDPEEEAPDMPNETWDSMVESVKQAAEERLDKEREPFRFSVFREDGEVVNWALMTDKQVEGKDSQVPVIAGHENKRDHDEAIFFDYPSRFHQERDDTVFEYVQKETIIPSNTFYAWISEAIEAVAKFNAEIDAMENEDVFSQLNPDLPPLYDQLDEYEEHALEFFGSVILEHRNYTHDQARLIIEAQRRYPIDDELWRAFTGELYEEEDQ